MIELVDHQLLSIEVHYEIHRAEILDLLVEVGNAVRRDSIRLSPNVRQPHVARNSHELQRAESLDCLGPEESQVEFVFIKAVKLHVVPRLVHVQKRGRPWLDRIKLSVVYIVADMKWHLSHLSFAIRHIRIEGVELDIVRIHFRLLRVVVFQAEGDLELLGLESEHLVCVESIPLFV